MKFQPAEMLVSYTATLPRWKIQPAEILSVTQPLFRGCHFNLPKCWSVTQPLFRGGNYNLAKYCQLHSHSSEVFLGCNYNLPKCWSIAQPLPLAHHPTVSQPISPSIPLSANPLAHQPHCRPTGGHLNLTVSRPITSPIVMQSATSAGLLLTPIMSHLLPGQSPEK